MAQQIAVHIMLLAQMLDVHKK